MPKWYHGIVLFLTVLFFFYYQEIIEYDCNTFLELVLAKMIHAKHFAATVNIKTEEKKQDSNCLAVVIEIMVQFSWVVSCYKLNLSSSVRNTNKKCSTVRPTDMFFLKLYNGFGIGFTDLKFTELTQLIKEHKTIEIRRKQWKSTNNEDLSWQQRSEMSVDQMCWFSCKTEPTVNSVKLHLLYYYYLQYVCIWLCVRNDMCVREGKSVCKRGERAR